MTFGRVQKKARWDTHFLTCSLCLRCYTAAAWKTADRMVDLHSCHTCTLDIERRYGVNGPRSTNQGYWSHTQTLAGLAADLDHAAVR
jgi:hypothetical protein